MVLAPMLPISLAADACGGSLCYKTEINYLLWSDPNLLNPYLFEIFDYLKKLELYKTDILAMCCICQYIPII